MYNYGFDRFGRVLEQFRDVTFIGHAQTWWANIDAKHADQSVLYPKGPVTRGGLTDRYLSDYPNMFGDLSAGSGLNALTSDEAFTRDFLERHQDKLLFGSDCSDREGGTREVPGHADHRGDPAAVGGSSNRAEAAVRKRAESWCGYNRRREARFLSHQKGDGSLFS